MTRDTPGMNGALWGETRVGEKQCYVDQGWTWGGPRCRKGWFGLHQAQGGKHHGGPGAPGCNQEYHRLGQGRPYHQD